MYSISNIISLKKLTIVNGSLTQNWQKIPKSSWLTSCILGFNSMIYSKCIIYELKWNQTGRNMKLHSVSKTHLSKSASVTTFVKVKVCKSGNTMQRCKNLSKTLMEAMLQPINLGLITITFPKKIKSIIVQIKLLFTSWLDQELMFQQIHVKTV